MKIPISCPTHRIILLAAIILAMIAPSVMYAQLPAEECSDTEAWIPAGSALSGRALAATEMNGSLYVVYSRFNTQQSLDSDLVLARLDGETWTTVSNFTISPRWEFNLQLLAYKGELYLVGNFTWVNRLDSTIWFAKWDGTEWKGVPGINMLQGSLRGSFLPRATIYKDELIIAGVFGTSFDDAYWGLAAYDGTTLRTIGRSTLPDDTIQVNSFAEWRGDLYVGGWLRDIEGLPGRGLARWDGTAWSRLPDDVTYVDQFAVYDDKLYTFYRPPLVDQVGLRHWDGTSWGGDLLPAMSRDRIYRWNLVPAVAVQNGEMYILATSYKLTTPPILMPDRLAFRWDGSTFRRIAGLNVTPRFMISHDGRLYAGGDFTYACSMTTKYIARLCDAGECGGISGRVVEASGDCEHLDAKPGIAENIIEVLPGPHYVMTDGDGNYRFMALPGTYTLRSPSPQHYRQSCPVANGAQTAVVTTPGESLKGVSFAHMPVPNVRDMSISIATARPRVGGQMRFVLTCTNRGTKDVDQCRVRLLVEPELQFNHAEPAESMRYPSILEWSLDNVRRGEHRTIEAYFAVPTTMPINTMVCGFADVDVMEIRRDADPASNFDSICAPARNSYDPNDIAVAPGVGEQGWISPDDSVLTYTIRFENTGNDTAYKVVVVDTLAAQLDFSSVRSGAASHPSRLRTGEGGALIWIFNDINLPASTMNSEGSQGFFRYSVRVKSGLAPNTAIANRASIYFDYNNPVVTNTVRSTIENPLSVAADEENADASDVMIYPNPTYGALKLRGELRKGSTITVRNLLGETVQTGRVEEGHVATIDLSDLPVGHYLIAFESAHGSVVRHVTLLR